MGVDPVSLAVTVALNAASMAMTASQKIEGPRLDDTSVTAADYGTPHNYCHGTRCFNGMSATWAEPLKEVKRRRKTKGGKFNEYTYFGTWAVKVLDMPSQAVTRIWFDKHLVYDATGAGPISPFTLGGAPITSYMRIYLGEVDAQPDPRMSATIDAALGPGSTPAFRNVTAIVFEDLPLEKIGNRLPQISVEVVTSASDHFPYEIKDAEVHAPQLGTTYSPDFSRVIWTYGTAFEIWDAAARAPMISGTFDPTGDPTGNDQILGIGLDGRIYCHGGAFGEDIVRYAADGMGPGSVVHATGIGLKFVRVLAYGDEGLELICAVPETSLGWDHHLVYAGMVVDTLTATGIDFSVRDYLRDTHGDVWALGSTSTDIVLTCLTNENSRLGDVISVTGPSLPPGDEPVHGFHYSDSTVDHFIVSWAETEFVTIDYVTGLITNTQGAVPITSGYPSALANTRPGAATFWTGGGSFAYEVSSVDLSLVRTADMGDWDSVLNGFVFDPINGALLGNPDSIGIGSVRVAWYFLDRVAGSGVTLRSIVEDIAEREGLESSEYDATALDQVITGYSWSQGDGKAILEPLLEAYDSEARPHDLELEFIKRGGASQGTIPVRDMAAGGSARYLIRQILDTDLPVRIDYSFADPAMDQQPNNVPAQRNAAATDSSRALSLDLTTLVLTPTQARAQAEGYLRRLWYEAGEASTSLSRLYSKLEPGDVWDLAFDDVTWTARLAKVEWGANGVLSTEWKRDTPAIHVAGDLSGQTADGYVSPEILAPGYTKGFVLDTPLATDADEGLISYVLAAPYSDDLTWPGAIVYESADGITYDDVYETIGSGDMATWGLATTVLASAEPEIWDNGSTVEISLQSGTLESATELQVANGANLAVIGSEAAGYEIVGFKTATLTAPDTYLLSGFLRGRRGTEAFVGGHATGDTFVMLDSARVRHVMGASDVGDLAYYRPVTMGAMETAGFPQALTYTGASLKPYSPSHIEGERDGSGNLTINWVRRTRIGGAWRDFADASLGEGSEAYQVDILDAGTVVRTITGLSSPTASYSAAEQVADFGVIQSAVDCNVYQMSTTVSRGFPGSATV